MMGIKFLMILPSVLLVTTYDAPNRVLMLLQTIISPVVYLVIAVIFWILAEPIARIIIGKDSDPCSALKINVQKLQASAFSVVGIYTLCFAIPGLVRAISNMLMLESLIPDINKASINYRAEIIGFGVQILIGILLLFGSKGIVNIIKKGREL